MTLLHRPCRLTVLAVTDAEMPAFGPFVPAIDDSGRVAFQCSLAGGHSAIQVHDGQTCVTWADTRAEGMPASAFISHPDLHAGGRVCVYADWRQGGQGVLVLDAPGQAQVWGAPTLQSIGPLGPTMNALGQVAVRGHLPDGRACVALMTQGACETLVAEDDSHQAFEGLPVVNGRGQVAIKARTADGRHLVRLHSREGLATAAASGQGPAAMNPFVVLDERGHVAFAGTDELGVPALFLGQPGNCQRLTAPDTAFESYRGLLLDDQGVVVFYGTPKGGQLGIYTGPEPAAHRLVGVGDAWEGGVVNGFALNPVSVNARGQIAVRVAVEDGREFIVRGDPA